WQGQSHELGTLRQALEKATTQSEEALERMRQFEREAIERVRASERRHAETIQRDRQLRVHLGTLASRLLSAAEAPVRAGEAIEPEDVEAVMEALMTVTRRTQEEIAWRRGEMARAKQASTGFLARLVGGEATSVMRDWDEIPMPQRPMEPAAWMGSDAQANLAFRPSAAAGSPARDIPVELPNFEPTPSAGSQTEISS
ncbi:MAG TPA: hypothetical protein PLJ12_16540, partial [Planctomycetota bacterium]|nr:hypothetical protein [Planctomycetota bacterium]